MKNKIYILTMKNKIYILVLKKLFDDFSKTCNNHFEAFFLSENFFFLLLFFFFFLVKMYHFVV